MPESADDTSLFDYSFYQQMRSKIPTHCSRHQIVQEEEDKQQEEDKQEEEEEVAHPSKIVQF